MCGVTNPTKIMTGEPLERVPSRPFSQNTVASSEWARDKAHRRRYDAVLDTVPSTNSIVSMVCRTSKHTRTKGRKKRHGHKATRSHTTQVRVTPAVRVCVRCVCRRDQHLPGGS